MDIQPPQPIRTADNAMPRRSASFTSLVDRMAGAIVVYRGDRILYCNPAMAVLTGRETADLVGRSLANLAVPERRAEFAALLDRPPAEAIAHYELPIASRDAGCRWLEVCASMTEFPDGPVMIANCGDITERKRAQDDLRQLQALIRQIIDGDPVASFTIDSEHRITHWNRACAKLTGYAAEAMIGRDSAWKAFFPAQRPTMADLIVDGAGESEIESYFPAAFRRSSIIEGAFEGERFVEMLGDGGLWLIFSAAPLTDPAGRIVGAIETVIDISQRKQAESALQVNEVELEAQVSQRTGELAKAKEALEHDIAQRQQAEAELRLRVDQLATLNARLSETQEQLVHSQEQLIQSEKLSSIGQLAAGVAHEINNPIGYVHSNIGSLEQYLADLLAMLAAYEAAEPAIAEPAQREAIARLRQQLDVDYLKSDVQQLVAESKEGITRVRKIVQDLKDFSRVDANLEWQFSNIHHGLDSTLNIANNELKYKADVVKEYGQLPDIECLPSQLNQVFMNLLVNAAHAIPDEPRGTINIRTGCSDDKVWIAISDTGCGIPPDNLKRIFDPFFTTKPVGKGTGLGLSLSYGIVQKHGGRIEVDSEIGKGTTFRIWLPVVQMRDGEDGRRKK